MADLISNPNYNPSLGATPTNQPYIFASPTQVINPQTGQTANQTTGMITSESLNPKPPIVPPAPAPQDNTATGIFGGADQTSNDIQKYIDMVKGPQTAQNQQASDLTSQISDLLGLDTGRGAAQTAAEQSLGIPDISKQLGDLNSQILQKTAEQKSIDSAYAQANQTVEGKPITMYSIQGQEAQNYKMYLAQRNSNASDLGLLQAQALGIQGKLDSAQKQADRAVDLKYQDIEAQYNTKLKQLDLVQGQLTKEEQIRSDALKLYLEDQQTKIQDQKDTDKQIQSIMLTAAQNQAPANVLNAISGAKSVLEATQLAQQYLQAQQQQEVTTAFYRVEGANEVFSSQTHQHITAEQAATIPNFWSQVTLLPQGSPQPAYNPPKIVSGGGGGGITGGGTTSTIGGALGTTGNSAIDTTVSGYATNIVAGGLTQSAIDQAALQFALTGNMPSIGLGSTGAAGEKRTAIQNRAAELDAGGNITAHKADVAALSSSLKQQTEYSNTVERSLGAAENGFQQIVDTFQSKGINNYEAPLANIIANAVKYNLGSADLNAFRAGMTEVANEYTQVFSRGGQVSDTVRAQAAKIANGDISMNDLGAVLNELQTQGRIVLQSTQNQVQTIQGKINNIIGSSSSDTSTIQSDIQSAIHDPTNFPDRESLINALMQHYGISLDEAAKAVYTTWTDNTKR